MQAGLGLLRLTPAAFWTMTPVELQTALDGLSGVAHRGRAASVTRADLARLNARFPDKAPPPILVPDLPNNRENEHGRSR